MSKKKLVHYKDTNVIFNEPVTVSYGFAYVDSSDFDTLFDNMVCVVNHMLDSRYYGKGVARCSTLDDYDKGVGNVVASCKAELNAIKKAEKDVEAVQRAVSKLNDYLTSELEKLEIHKNKITSGERLDRYLKKVDKD